MKKKLKDYIFILEYLLIILSKKKWFLIFFKEKNDSSYNKDIIYGITSDYQGNILKDEYQLSGVRKRNFDIVIVDKRDSMFIDEYTHKKRLAITKFG